MPDKLFKVTDGLYRGGAPTPKEVSSVLKDVFNISKIISLDEECGNDIKDTCKDLNINQIIIPLGDGNSPNIQDLKDIIPTLLSDGPTYIHCRHGKDRTGTAVAMFRIYNGTPLNDALVEAHKIGMGKGLRPSTSKTYYDAVKKYAEELSDKNNAEDIVTREREENPFGIGVPNPFISNFAPYDGGFSPLSRLASFESFLVKKAENNKIYKKCNPKNLLDKNSIWFKTKELANNNSFKGDLYSAELYPNVNIESFNTNIISTNDIKEDTDVIIFNKGNYFLIFSPYSLINIEEENEDVNNSFSGVGLRDNSTDYSSFGPYSGSGIGGIPEGAAGFGTLPFTGPGQV